MKEIYIIERDGNVVYYKLPKSNLKNFNDEIYIHEYYFRKYMKDKNIKLDNNNLTSYELAEQLTKIGLSSIIVDHKMMCIFLPQFITKEQFDWYVSKNRALKRFDISYGFLKGNEFVTIDPDYEIGEKTKIKDFYKYIRNNIQMKKEGEIDEYRRLI